MGCFFEEICGYFFVWGMLFFWNICYVILGLLIFVMINEKMNFCKSMIIVWD